MFFVCWKYVSCDISYVLHSQFPPQVFVQQMSPPMLLCTLPHLVQLTLFHYCSSSCILVLVALEVLVLAELNEGINME